MRSRTKEKIVDKLIEDYIEKKRGEKDMENKLKKEIDWEVFESGKYVKIVAGVPIELNLISVEQTTTTFPPEKEGEVEKTVPSLEFDVNEEDGEEVEKKLSVTSKRLINQLKPFVDEGLPQKVKILQTGTSFDTQYSAEAV